MPVAPPPLVRPRRHERVARRTLTAIVLAMPLSALIAGLLLRLG